MKTATDAVCPIFVLHNKTDRLEQIGSGVLIHIKDKTFLLTAAHVTDWMEVGYLCVPTDDGINEITGHYASLLTPTGLNRNADKLDMAYFLLSNELAIKLGSYFYILKREEYWLTDNLLDGDVYTFTGYPLSKAKVVSDNVYTSEMFSYTGEAAVKRKYKSLKFNAESNIIINFRIKKAIDLYSGKKRMPPHPRGISGGAIFRWPKCHGDSFERNLVGIGHRYLSKHNCLVGTKIPMYFSFIAANHPDLFKDEVTNNQNSIPLFLALVAYKKEEWDTLMSQFEDAENMQSSWAEWRNSAEYGVEHMDRSGKSIIPIEVSADEIQSYCETHNLPNTGHTRVGLANERMYAMIKESGILKI